MSDNHSNSTADNKPPSVDSDGRGYEEGDGGAAQPPEAAAAAARGSPSDQKVAQRRKDGRMYVEKNSLDETSLLAAREEARIKLEKINELGDATEQDINEDRRAANRLSAFQSRKRRKGNVKALQSKVDALNAENNEQSQKIGDQQGELKAMLEENARLRGRIADNHNDARQDGIPTEIGGPGATALAVGGQSSSSDERKQPAAAAQQQQQGPSVVQMIQTLKDLNEKQGDEVRQQKMNQKASRQKLTACQNKEQQSLLAAQGKEAHAMEALQLQERSDLAAAQSRQLSTCITNFGFSGGNTDEALALFRELNDVQAATAQVTAAAEQVGAASQIQQQAQQQQQEEEQQQPTEGAGGGGGNDNHAAAEALNQLHHSLQQEREESLSNEEEDDDSSSSSSK
jgi:bZIP transcription factor